MSGKQAHSARAGAMGLVVEQGAALAAIEAGTDRSRQRVGKQDGDPRRKDAEHFDIVVIGGGQSGLSIGYHLARRGVNFVILDGAKRIGDSWRRRWDSLRLFTPARFCGLDGMPFPGDPAYFPTKNEMADYLEAYADRFKLPVRTGTKVEALTKEGARYVISCSGARYTADQVVVANANYQEPRRPAFADDLDPGITQLHSVDYRNPGQLRDGAVLLVGAGNSGADIAMELAKSRRVLLSGRHTGHVPFRIEGFMGRHLLVRLLLRGVFHRVLTLGTPMGRKMRPKLISKGVPLVRVKPQDLNAAGVVRVPRVARVSDGRPVLEDGSTPDIANVIWCTGFHPGLSWIDLPIFEEDGEPRHEAGIVTEQPGLYLVGLHFLYSVSSSMIHGVGRDAARIAGAAAARVREKSGLAV